MLSATFKGIRAQRQRAFPPEAVPASVEPEDTAFRLWRYFGTSAQFWVTVQSQYDLTDLPPALNSNTPINALKYIENP